MILVLLKVAHDITIRVCWWSVDYRRRLEPEDQFCCVGEYVDLTTQDGGEKAVRTVAIQKTFNNFVNETNTAQMQKKALVITFNTDFLRTEI